MFAFSFHNHGEALSEEFSYKDVHLWENISTLQTLFLEFRSFLPSNPLLWHGRKTYMGLSHINSLPDATRLHCCPQRALNCGTNFSLSLPKRLSRDGPFCREKPETPVGWSMWVFRVSVSPTQALKVRCSCWLCEPTMGALLNLLLLRCVHMLSVSEMLLCLQEQSQFTKPTGFVRGRSPFPPGEYRFRLVSCLYR